MAVPKAVALLGIGSENLHYIPCDDFYRMIPSELERAICADEANGRTPMAVAASAGTVNTGSIDRLTEIAPIAAPPLVDACGRRLRALAAMAVPQKFAGLGEWREPYTLLHLPWTLRYKVLVKLANRAMELLLIFPATLFMTASSRPLRTAPATLGIAPEAMGTEPFPRTASRILAGGVPRVICTSLNLI